MEELKLRCVVLGHDPQRIVTGERVSEEGPQLGDAVLEAAEVFMQCSRCSKRLPEPKGRNRNERQEVSELGNRKLPHHRARHGRAGRRRRRGGGDVVTGVDRYPPDTQP